MAAFKRYNNVQLDGKLMKIEIVGTNIATGAAPSAANGNFGSSNGAPRGYALLYISMTPCFVQKFRLYFCLPFVRFRSFNYIVLESFTYFLHLGCVF